MVESIGVHVNYAKVTAHYDVTGGWEHVDSLFYTQKHIQHYSILYLDFVALDKYERKSCVDHHGKDYLHTNST